MNGSRVTEFDARHLTAHMLVVEPTYTGSEVRASLSLLLR